MGFLSNLIGNIKNNFSDDKGLFQKNKFVGFGGGNDYAKSQLDLGNSNIPLSSTQQPTYQQFKPQMETPVEQPSLNTTSSIDTLKNRIKSIQGLTQIKVKDPVPQIQPQPTPIIDRVKQIAQTGVNNLSAWGDVAKQGIKSQVDIQKRDFKDLIIDPLFNRPGESLGEGTYGRTMIKPFEKPVTDIYNVNKNYIEGNGMLPYEELQSPATKLTYQALSALGNKNVGDVPTNGREVVGNVAEQGGDIIKAILLDRLFGNVPTPKLPSPTTGLEAFKQGATSWGKTGFGYGVSDIYKNIQNPELTPEEAAIKSGVDVAVSTGTSALLGGIINTGIYGFQTLRSLGLQNKELNELKKTLGAKPDATLEEVRTAYRESALKYHPDRNKSPDAEKMMTDINNAYEILQKKIPLAQRPSFSEWFFGPKVTPQSPAVSPLSLNSGEISPQTQVPKVETPSIKTPVVSTPVLPQQEAPIIPMPPPANNNLISNILTPQGLEAQSGKIDLGAKVGITDQPAKTGGDVKPDTIVTKNGLVLKNNKVEVSKPEGEEITVYRTSPEVKNGDQVFTNKQGAEMYATPNEPVTEFKVRKDMLEPSLFKEKADAGIMTYKGDSTVTSRPLDDIFTSGKSNIKPEKIDIKPPEMEVNPSKIRDMKADGQAFEFYSPNIEEHIDFETARSRLTSPRQAWFKSATDDINTELGLETKSYNAMGDWGDGAENTVVSITKNTPDYETVRYTAAKKGKVGNQKATIPFRVEQDGPNTLYEIDTAGKDMVKLRSDLDTAGIKFRTLVDQTGGEKVFVFDPDNELEPQVISLITKYGTDARRYKGRGEFLGSWNTRIEGTKVYNKVISDYEAKNNRRNNGKSGNRVQPVKPSSKKIDDIVAAPKTDEKNFNVDEYVKEQVAKQKEAIKKSNPKTIKQIIKDVKTKLIDSSSPLTDILTSAEKKGKFEVLPKNDIRLQIDRVLKSRQIAGQYIKDNGLYDVIKSVPDIDKFNQYIIAKQALDVQKQGIETGRDTVKDTQLIKEYAPEYEEYSKQLNKFARKLLQYFADEGLIPKDLPETLNKKFPNYVPITRIMEEIEAGNIVTGGKKGIASLSKQGVVFKLKGSERQIVNPTETFLIKTVDGINQIERNKAGRMLASYRDLPGFEGLITELASGETAKNTFSFLDNGKKRVFETTPELAAAAKSLDVETFGLLAKIISTPTRILQMGATGLNVPFVIRNIVKDQMTLFINSNETAKASLMNPLNFTKAFLTAIKHGDLYDEVIRNAGMSTSYEISREAPRTTVDKIRSNRDIKSKIAYTILHPDEVLNAVENIIGRSEELGRLQSYAGTKQALLDKGRTLEDAELLAAQAGRENTANFGRSGLWGKVLNKIIPFFNAGIQGARQLVKSFTTHPGKTSIKMAVGVFLPMVAYTAWNLADEKRKKVYEDIQEYEKENNFIIIPENPTKNDKGQWNVVKIPLPPGISNLASISRKSIESANGLDSLVVKDIVDNLFTASTSLDLSSGTRVASTFTPQALKPSIETATNRNLFTGKEIVPSQMKNLPPEEQKTKYTSQLAIDVGAKLDVSPLIVENFIKTSSGGLGNQLINTYDKAVGKKDPGGQSIVDSVVTSFSKASGGKTYDDASKEFSKGMNAKETLAYDYLHLGKVYDENGLPSQSGDLRDSMTNASIRLSSPEILTREAAEARARAKVDGSPVNPLYNLPPDKQKIVLTITSLPTGDAYKKKLTNDNLEWLKPYWAEKEIYSQKMVELGVFTSGAKAKEGEVARPIASDSVQAAMDAKNWNAPGVQEYLSAYKIWQNQELAKLGLSSDGYGSGSGWNNWKKADPNVYTFLNKITGKVDSTLKKDINSIIKLSKKDKSSKELDALISKTYKSLSEIFEKTKK